MKHKSFISKYKWPLLAAAIVLVLIIGATVFAVSRSRDNSPNDGTVKPDSESINYNPATDTEKSEAESHKNNLSNSSNQGSSNATGGGVSAVTVTMTYASDADNQVEAGGYVTGFTEEGGTCTLTLTKGSQTVSQTSTGFIDVNKITCPQITISKQRLSERGQWTAVLSYKSNKAAGSSSPQEVSIQ